MARSLPAWRSTQPWKPRKPGRWYRAGTSRSCVIRTTSSYLATLKWPGETRTYIVDLPAAGSGRPALALRVQAVFYPERGGGGSRAAESRDSAPGDPAVSALVEAPGLRDPGLAREADADPGPLHEVRVADRQAAVLEVE